MDKEIKLSLPFYKIVYAMFFVAILSVIRGVSLTYEIGIALEAPMAMLAAVFCADTYVQEIASKRSEVERLCPMKKRVDSIVRRIIIQEIFLSVLAVTGYWMFLIIQKPHSLYGVQQGAESEQELFFMYLAAIVVTLIFWGILSHTLSCLFRNMWAGISISLIIWIVTNSSAGECFLGSWNLFSYTFRDIEDSGDLSWIYGKTVCIVLSIVMIMMLPPIIKKRG